MICYIDSSVVLRVLKGQSDAWKEWGRWEKAYSSAILRVECRRFIDRMRVQEGWNDDVVARAGAQLRSLERVLGRIRLTVAVMERAAMPMPTVIKTLDALHIASASLLRERRYPQLVFVTHDQQQEKAARALGFDCASTS
jgi:predicted nucleic acid-binding protein